MKFFKRVLLSILQPTVLQPVQNYLNKVNPTKIVLADSQVITEGMNIIAQKVLEDRMKELELQYHILTTRLLEPLVESQKLLVHIAGMNEEVLNYFEESISSFEEEMAKNETPENSTVNKYGLN